MATFFDALTVACFIGLVLAFFRYTDRDIPTLLRYMVSAITLGVANQVGNMGYVVFGGILVIAAIGFGWLSFPKPNGGRS
jgi:hypothetical protein